MGAEVFAELNLVAVKRAVGLGEVVGLEAAFGGDRYTRPRLFFRMGAAGGKQHRRDAQSLHCRFRVVHS
ncbi:hypothetical protein D3C87_1998610 [compost metagenome]